MRRVALLLALLLGWVAGFGQPVHARSTYDDADRLDVMTDGAGSTSYAYDAVGRLTTSSRAG